MAAQRQAAQIDQVVRWLHQARAATGRFQPILAVGRDGVKVPLRHGDGQEGATATVSGLARRGKRVGTVSLGGHAPAGTFHFGVRLDGEYVNPLLLLGGVPRAVLLPCC